MRAGRETRKPEGILAKPLPKGDQPSSNYAGLREWQAELSISRLFQTSIRLQNAFDRCFQQFGMSAQEAAVLLHCVEQGESSAGRLAQAIGRDKGRITRLVDRLEVGGFLSRQSHPHEHRRSVIRPTPRGRRVAPQLKLRFQVVRSQLFEGVPSIDIDRLEILLERLHSNAERLGGKAL